MTIGLDGYVTRGQRPVGAGTEQPVGVGILFVEHQVRVFDRQCPINDLPHARPALNLRKNGYPLVAGNRDAAQFRAFILEYGTADFHASAVFAYIARGMSAEEPPADDVEFHRHRELLIFEHGFRRLAMELDAAVLIAPRRCTSDLLADEAVFRPKPVMRQ